MTRERGAAYPFRARSTARTFEAVKAGLDHRATPRALLAELVQDGRLRACKVKVVELPAITAMQFGANFVARRLRRVNAHELNLALHWYVRTAEAHALNELDGNMNPVAMWDERFSPPAFPELVGRCHAFIEHFSFEGEKEALEALKKDEQLNGMHFASLLTLACEANATAQSVKARTAAGTRRNRTLKRSTKIAAGPQAIDKVSGSNGGQGA